MSSKTLKGSGKNKEVLFLIAVPLRGGGGEGIAHALHFACLFYIC